MEKVIRLTSKEGISFELKYNDSIEGVEISIFGKDKKLIADNINLEELEASSLSQFITEVAEGSL
jgi:hypothetical protein